MNYAGTAVKYIYICDKKFARYKFIIRTLTCVIVSVQNNLREKLGRVVYGIVRLSQYTHAMFVISTTHKEDFIIRVIYVYSSMHESVLAVRDECQLLWPRHVHRLCPIDVRRAATPLINRVMVYRPGNCVCHRQRVV